MRIYRKTVWWCLRFLTASKFISELFKGLFHGSGDFVQAIWMNIIVCLVITFSEISMNPFEISNSNLSQGLRLIIRQSTCQFSFSISDTVSALEPSFKVIKKIEIVEISSQSWWFGSTSSSWINHIFPWLATVFTIWFWATIFNSWVKISASIISELLFVVNTFERSFLQFWF